VKLPLRQLSAFLARYDTLVEEGIGVNPEPKGRDRDYIERRSFNLVSALKELRTEATLFAVDLRLPFTNNQGERDLRMAKFTRRSAAASTVTTEPSISQRFAPTSPPLESTGSARSSRSKCCSVATRGCRRTSLDHNRSSLPTT
jgi:hypothetical protein